jgi:hypothetical protein
VRTSSPTDFSCNPGHPDAVAAGCACDQAKNRYGLYASNGGVQPWIVSSGCPLHGLNLERWWTAREAKHTGTAAEYAQMTACPACEQPRSTEPLKSGDVCPWCGDVA